MQGNAYHPIDVVSGPYWASFCARGYLARLRVYRPYLQKRFQTRLLSFWLVGSSDCTKAGRALASSVS